MQVICSAGEAATTTPHPHAAERTLPLPTLVDSHVVVLLHLLLEERPQHPVVLDASGMQRIQPVAALLLAVVLRNRMRTGAPVRIANLPFALRKQVERHPLTRFLDQEQTGNGGRP